MKKLTLLSLALLASGTRAENPHVEHAKKAAQNAEQDAKDLTRILPASKKVYVEGSRPDIQVPFREISLTDTPTGLGGEHNPPIDLWRMITQGDSTA